MHLFPSTFFPEAVIKNTLLCSVYFGRLLISVISYSCTVGNSRTPLLLLYQGELASQKHSAGQSVSYVRDC